MLPLAAQSGPMVLYTLDSTADQFLISESLIGKQRLPHQWENRTATTRNSKSNSKGHPPPVVRFTGECAHSKGGNPTHKKREGVPPDNLGTDRSSAPALPRIDALLEVLVLLWEHHLAPCGYLETSERLFTSNCTNDFNDFEAASVKPPTPFAYKRDPKTDQHSATPPQKKASG